MPNPPNRSDGAPGIDGVTFESIDVAAVDGFLVQLRDALDAIVVSSLPDERGPAAVGRARVQLGQSVATAGATQAHRLLVADERAAETRQNPAAAYSNTRGTTGSCWRRVI